MNILDRINLNLSYNNIGRDIYGNRYYESKSCGVIGKYRRIVRYKGIVEPTTVPPLWHAWLHYLKDSAPTEDELRQQDWQKEYMPNMTGLNTKKLFAEYNSRKIPSGYKAWRSNERECDYE